MQTIQAIIIFIKYMATTGSYVDYRTMVMLMISSKELHSLLITLCEPLASNRRVLENFYAPMIMCGRGWCKKIVHFYDITSHLQLHAVEGKKRSKEETIARVQFMSKQGAYPNVCPICNAKVGQNGREWGFHVKSQCRRDCKIWHMEHIALIKQDYIGLIRDCSVPECNERGTYADMTRHEKKTHTSKSVCLMCGHKTDLHNIPSHIRKHMSKNPKKTKKRKATTIISRNKKRR